MSNKFPYDWRTPDAQDEVQELRTELFELAEAHSKAMSESCDTMYDLVTAEKEIEKLRNEVTALQLDLEDGERVAKAQKKLAMHVAKTHQEAHYQQHENAGKLAVALRAADMGAYIALKPELHPSDIVVGTSQAKYWKEKFEAAERRASIFEAMLTEK